MKPTIRLTLSLMLVVLFASCLDSFNNSKEEHLSLTDDFVPVEVKDQYSIQVPKYMNETEELNDEASLQYLNGLKETYVIIIDEPKDDFISVYQSVGGYDDSISIVENYRTVQLRLFDLSLEMKTQTKPKRTLINGLDAEQVQFDGKIEDVSEEIAYFATFVEGPENLYMILAWTLKSRKNKYRSTFEMLSNSFRVIGL